MSFQPPLRRACAKHLDLCGTATVLVKAPRQQLANPGNADTDSSTGAAFGRKIAVEARQCLCLALGNFY